MVMACCPEKMISPEWSRVSFYFQTLVLFLCLALHILSASAQVGASLSGVITDQTGAVLAGVDVSLKNLDTGVTRTTTTDDAGRYYASDLPLGRFEIHAARKGFADETRTGITLVVGEDATVDLRMQVSPVSQHVTIDADAPLVSTATADVSGLVGERQVKDLPLNGRSYDLLLTLNPAVVNFTSEKTGGTGISNSSTANNFAISGNRPEQNLFLLNGVEYSGAAENNMTPGGPSGQLLGVDAVREFNVLRDSYGVEYGKHPGGQVLIVTQSGSNQWHGSVYEFFRNNDLNARNYFDVGSAPLFQRNQFGGAIGGPIVKDKTFLFLNYEGFRQNWHQTSVTYVPSDDARSGTLVPFGSTCAPAQRAACAVAVENLLNLWPAPNGPELRLPSGLPSGIATLTSSPLQTIREDFGTARVDHFFSQKDTVSAIYTIDDGANVNATVFDPYSSDITNLREQVLSLSETHIFSPSLLNTAQFGYSRAAYFFTGKPTPGTPAVGVTSFVGELPVGAVVVGGSTASNPATQLGLAGSNNGSNLRVFRNLFTYQDQVTWTHGKHQWNFGVWFQQFQSNETLALSQYGQLSFPSVAALLGGGGPTSNVTFLYDPTPTQLNWRSLFAAWYVEDVIRLTPRLTVSLGFRDEFSTGWNEAHGRAANYFFTNGVINTNPHIGNSAFSVNNATFLPQPRIGIAWSPFGAKTVVRAGFGMYNDLQDALGYRMDQNAPFNPTYSIANFSVSSLPEPVSPIPANAKLVPGGVQPNLNTPTLISYSLRVEQSLSQNTVLTVGYVGAHGYHELLGLDANTPVPAICPAAPCPADYPAGFGALSGTPVPVGSYYIQAGSPLANPSPVIANTWTWFSLGTSSYNALQVDLNHRFSQGLSFRGVYTWSRALDDGDSLNGTLAQNAPGLVANPDDIKADWGRATYDATNVGSINALYELPFGPGKSFANGLEGWSNALVSGWSLASIVTLQDGFPFTPQLSYNPSNNKDNRNPVRPFVNPDFTGPVKLGTPAEWFNPNAFIAPPNNSGFFGDLRRNAVPGPGLATWDFSILKDTAIRERLHLQFRAEIFNILNRANFNTPNLIVATVTGNTPVPNPAAGSITSTSTSARQVQFALKLLW
jgi:Carboxypeptidase regulatory-like domain